MNTGNRRAVCEGRRMVAVAAPVTVRDEKPAAAIKVLLDKREALRARFPALQS